MKKKLLSLCLACVMLITVGCGSEKTNSDKQSNANTLEGTYVVTELSQSILDKLVFSADGTVRVVWVGKYTKIQADDGMQYDMTLCADTTPYASYMIKKTGDSYSFAPMQNGNVMSNNSIQINLDSGSDGLSNLEPFDGVFSTSNQDTVLTFQKDGLNYTDTLQTYQLVDDALLLTYMGGTCKLDFSANNDLSEITVVIQETPEMKSQEVTLVKQ
ncbi:MAG: hypothetical protein IKL07_01250 [Clostridium sp.]|nr:hypothetical protein [Clostridium sp.]